jgi:outer membrane protein assembly factor BamB
MCNRNAGQAICLRPEASTVQRILVVFLALVGMGCPGVVVAEAPCWPRFHGLNGQNISAETGLLKQWPEGGPKLLWTARGIGQGFATVAVADGRIYTAGDVGGDLVIFALDMDGQIQWQAKHGAAWKEVGPAGARATPTIDGQQLYHENAHDEVVCLDVKDGRKLWEVNLASQFQGKRDGFGRAESLLIDGDRVICCPGGATAMAALDKRTGRTVWKSPTAGEPAGYASPILAEHQGLRMILTMASRSLIGVHARTGDLLWRFEHYTPRYVANCVTPIYHDGRVFVSGGYGLGSALLKINVQGDKAAVEPVWRSKDLDNRHGGVILLEGCVYGASHFNNNAKWICLDWKTGRKMYAERGIGEGSLTCADGMIYTMSDSRKVGLVRPAPTGYELISEFKIPEGGEGPTWAHPVVVGGRLYIRHGDRLYAYAVRANELGHPLRRQSL